MYVSCDVFVMEGFFFFFWRGEGLLCPYVWKWVIYKLWDPTVLLCICVYSISGCEGCGVPNGVYEVDVHIHIRVANNYDCSYLCRHSATEIDVCICVCFLSDLVEPFAFFMGLMLVW